MDFFQINADATLFVSSDIDDWHGIENRRITVIVDMDGLIDNVPTKPDHFLYVYYPIYDEQLPDLDKLHAISHMVANLSRSETVLVHCQMGFNRSCLVMGVALTYLGMSGREAIDHLRSIRPGALFNENFAAYLETLPAASLALT
ncbi:MAG: dual specificity protein phosphatase family protein [Blastocatellia bacterium]|nr:dual specificity protein phosphatase family protein [Blastocatellia bacterium]